ncbi:MAG: GTP-binding protein [Hyphomicrobiales bacterium]|nr:MAG: GTP-binding protein [Hyphomicrobiales bacterium]
MSLPVTLVTGFLGAGKTSFINRLLTENDGRRFAAIVNDFGAINIDAELIAERSDNVIGLANGCVCCSLQGDLLRVLKTLLTRPGGIDQIVIEASGVADPNGIIAALGDPELWAHVQLSAVIAVIGAEDVDAMPALLDDPLWRTQIAAADFIVLAKTFHGIPPALGQHLAGLGNTPVFDGDAEPLPLALLFDPLLDRPRPSAPPLPLDAASRFVSLEWNSAAPGRLPAFQHAIETLAPLLLRAKGIVNFAELPDRPLLFQMVGRRASLTPIAPSRHGNRLVLIGDRTSFSPGDARQLLAAAFPEP